jgi:hypothetical protein
MGLTGMEGEQVIPVGSFLGNLPEMLVAMLADARPLVAIAEFADDRYVQFWVEDDRIEAEVVSNVNVPLESPALSAAEEELLCEAGWHEPGPDLEARPNYYRHEHGPQAAMELSFAVADAAVRILGVATPPSSPVRLRTFAPFGPGDPRVRRRRHEAEADGEGHPER